MVPQPSRWSMPATFQGYPKAPIQRTASLRCRRHSTQRPWCHSGSRDGCQDHSSTVLPEAGSQCNRCRIGPPWVSSAPERPRQPTVFLPALTSAKWKWMSGIRRIDTTGVLGLRLEPTSKYCAAYRCTRLQAQIFPPKHGREVNVGFLCHCVVVADINCRCEIACADVGRGGPRVLAVLNLVG